MANICQCCIQFTSGVELQLECSESSCQPESFCLLNTKPQVGLLFVYLFVFMTHAPLQAESCHSRPICTLIIQLELLVLDGEECARRRYQTEALQPLQPSVAAGSALISGSLPQAVVSFFGVEVKQI